MPFTNGNIKTTTITSDTKISLDATNEVEIPNTTESSSITSGSLIVAGGVAIVKNLYVGGSIYGTITDPTLDHGELVGLSDDDHTQYGLLAGRGNGQTFIGGTNASSILTLRSSSNVAKGYIYLDETTESVGTNSGALVLSGGTGIAKQLNIGGITKIYDTTVSASTSTGAMVVAGGVGIAKQLHLGDTFLYKGYTQLPVKQRYFWTNTNSAETITGGTIFPPVTTGSTDGGVICDCATGDLIEVYFNVTCYLNGTSAIRYIEGDIYKDTTDGANLICLGIDQIANVDAFPDYGNFGCHHAFVATQANHKLLYVYLGTSVLSYNRGINVGFVVYNGNNHTTIIDSAITF